jgi:hypothetical protein
MRSALAAGVDRLIASQAAAWPLLARGIEGLRESVTRRLPMGDSQVLVRHIRHRIRSTTAAVDPASILKRPCFLCRENLPPEEEGIAVDADFTAYANPFPILESHLTVVHREHRPQAIAGFVTAALRLADALPDHFVVYNGPECGASAPDHLHLQACSREIFPIEDDARGAEGPLVPGDGRRLYVLRGGEAQLARRVERLIAILKDLTGRAAEPMVNLAFFHEAGRGTVLLFPRAKHRPRAFETGELTVSPATIDMSGVVVVPLPGDFERITSEDVRTIYDEVTLAPEPFAAAWARMEREE